MKVSEIVSDFKEKVLNFKEKLDLGSHLVQFSLHCNLIMYSGNEQNLAEFLSFSKLMQGLV